jgi:DNA-binding NarL/FixJ family response regulator
MPRILIADDDASLRQSVRSLLAKQSDWNISEAETGKTAIEKARDEKPEVVLLDLLMPSGNGIMAAYKIRQIAPATKILFLTDQCGPEQASAISRLLGSGEFVPKADVKTHLVPSINRLLKVPEQSLPEVGVLPGAPPTVRKMRSSEPTLPVFPASICDRTMDTKVFQSKMKSPFCWL